MTARLQDDEIDWTRRQNTSLDASGEAAAVLPSAPDRWRYVRWTAFTVYLACVAAFVDAKGVPTGRLAVSVIVISGLMIGRIGQDWRRIAAVLVDWLPFTAVLMLYDRTRGLADSLGISVHQRDILHLERFLWGGTEPTVWLQQHLYDPATVHWYDALCTLVYTTHFVATPLLAAFFWVRNREVWLRYMSQVVALSVAGLATYILFPEAPPWYAARSGLTPPVDRLSARGWEYLNLGPVKALLHHAQSDGSNAVAAMPSLHTAFAVLFAIAVGSRLTSRWRWLLVLYPVAMGFTLVYTGEHYVVDLVAGVVYATATYYAVNWWFDRRRRTQDDTRAAERIG